MPVTTDLPPAELLSLVGMGCVALFGVWKVHVVPYLARRRDTARRNVPNV